MLEREKSGLLISEEQQREIGYIIVLNAALQGGNLTLARAAAERLGHDLDEILNEAPRANARVSSSSLGGASPQMRDPAVAGKSAEAEDRHSSTVSWFDPAHHLEPAERRPWSSAKEDNHHQPAENPENSVDK